MIAVALCALFYILQQPALAPLAPSANLPTFEQAGGPRLAPAPLPSPPVRSDAALRDDCPFPPMGESDQLVLLSAIRGQAISSVALNSQDIAVSTATITVAPGSGPIYVVMVSDGAVIWRFTGATDRIRAVAFAGGHQFALGSDAPLLNAETGIARDKVSFFPERCMDAFTDASTAAASRATEIVRRALGRAPDVVLAGEAISDFAIPSGAATAKPYLSALYRFEEGVMLRIEAGLSVNTKPRPQYVRQQDAEYPDGVVQIDPASVIASGTAIPYEVLPGNAGLAQLVASGALQDMGSDEFHIRRKIRMPAELRMPGFLLLKGVPPPDGNISTVCIVSQETGKLLAGENSAFC